jgi:hypothetical protein
VKTAVRTAEGFDDGYAAGLLAAPVDPTMLSEPQQKKNERWRAQELKRLNDTFEQRVMDEVTVRLEDTILPAFRKLEQEAKDVIRARKGVMTKRTFKKIQSYLHPDRPPPYSEGFNLFTALESKLLSEKEQPSVFGALPTTLVELEEARRKVQEARKSKRQGNNVQIAHG